MTIEGIKCDQCGSNEVTEYKPNSYVCAACDHIFKFVDPTHTEVQVAPQFCEEGCGNPIKYKCAICGKMVCEGHGEKAKVLLDKGSEYGTKATLANTSHPDLQQAWCGECFTRMNNEDRASYIVRALGDPDYGVRYAVVQALGATGDPTAVPYLCEALKDKHYGVRYAVVQALGATGDPTAVPFLVNAIEDEKGSVREAVAEALGKIGNSEAIPQLGKLIDDASPSVRLKAVWALEEINSPSSEPFLRRALEDSDFKIRHSAMERLGHVGDASAVSNFCAELKGGNDVRDSAARALGRLGDPFAVPQIGDALIAELGSSNPRIKDMIKALGQIGDPSAVPYLGAAITDPHSGERTAAVEALRMIGDPSAVPYLCEVFRSIDSWDIERASEALVEIGTPAVPYLMQLRKRVRWTEVADVLEKIGEPQGVQAASKARRKWARKYR